MNDREDFIIKECIDEYLNNNNNISTVYVENSKVFGNRCYCSRCDNKVVNSSDEVLPNFCKYCGTLLDWSEIYGEFQ